MASGGGGGGGTSISGCRTSGSVEACGRCCPCSGVRCQRHSWQFAQARPCRQPDFRRTYLQGGAQQFGWPQVPTEISTARPAARSPSSSMGLATKCPRPCCARDVVRCQQHLWQSGQLAPSRHPVFFRMYLQALAQLKGCPRVPTENSASSSATLVLGEATLPAPEMASPGDAANCGNAGRPPAPMSSRISLAFLRCPMVAS
mmetsp:Transcript_64736/g.208480  ORF Transcript_64736/g.208480 Transcript_64736/m.208480 type:complete len:202 (+) Transcript_64736:500-1105(+)